MTSSSQTNRLSSIQALRGLAALLVLLFHIIQLQRIHIIGMDAPNLGEEMALLRGPFRQGYAGVDLFFVISGFIMVYIAGDLKRGATSALTFLRRRIIRIFPLWWVFCAILMLYYMATLGAAVSPRTVPAGTPEWLFLVKSAALIPQSMEPILGLGWTLIYEMYFYIVFAALLFLPAKWRMTAMAIWALITLSLYALNPPPVLAGTYPQLFSSLLTLEFIAGAFAGWLVLRGKTFAPKAIFAVGAIGFIAALCLYTDTSEVHRTWGRVAVFTLPLAALVYGAAATERVYTLRLPRALTWLGNISYSLYLSHILVLGVLIRIWPKLPLPSIGSQGSLDNWLYAAIAIPICLITAALFYYAAERPLLLFLRRKPLAKSAP